MPSPLLLDLDGTLIDSEPWYKRTEVDALNEFGIPITLDEMEEFTGLTLPMWLKTLNARYDTDVQQNDFLKDYKPMMIEHVEKNVQMFPDAVSFLDRIDGQPAILVTSSMDWYVEVVLKRFPEIRERIQGVVCEADVVKGKPDPEPYLIASGKLNADPTICWVIEDAPNGVKSGLAAGCHVIGIDRYKTGRIDFASRVVETLDVV